ncbi:Ig-like domain-containing protein [Butyrivibrio sp. MC2013]|uniref:Ig-like domain-containing protein n=1 Tax=Butyrivibrio sp. MC2013 TaxID=1280686 RepID=UPI0003F504F1|nr:Ig-like domain-containing protein [Butyrivibrio sp. MC2013]
MKKSVLALLMTAMITIQPVGGSVVMAAEADSTIVTEAVTNMTADDETEIFDEDIDVNADDEAGEASDQETSQPIDDESVESAPAYDEGNADDEGADQIPSSDAADEEVTEAEDESVCDEDQALEDEENEGGAADEPSDDESADPCAIAEDKKESSFCSEEAETEEPFAGQSYDLSGSIVDDGAAIADEDAAGADLFAAQGSNVKVNIPGHYYTESASTILAEINRIRKEACNLGLKDPNTGKKLTAADYKPLVWSKDMEAIARTRAAEANVNISHTRPNGESCFSVKSPWGEQAWGEDLAWNSEGSRALMAGIKQFYDEKNDYINKTQKGQNTGQTGHYESLISTRYTAIGVAAFAAEGEVYNWTAVAAELTYKSGLRQDKDSFQGKSSPAIEMSSSYITIGSIQGSDKLEPGNTATYSVAVTAQSKSSYGTSKYTNATLASGLMKWSSSDSSILSIDSVSGRANALKSGSATVKAAISGISATKTKAVKVNSKAVKQTQSLSLDKSEVTMEITSANTAPAITLSSKIDPVSSASEITWSSSNKKVAVVDGEGKVTAKGPGTATITATSPDKTMKASCKIRITRSVDSLTLTGKSTLNITSKTAKPSTRLKATVKPSNASNKTVTWESSNPDILTVNSKGKVVSTGKLGKATIYAKADNGKIVKYKEINVICRTEKVKVSPGSYKLGVGNVKTLAMSVKPVLADKSKVEWFSSNPEIATVDYNGNVRGLSEGSVVITARTSDGTGKKASCKIKVGKAVEGIQLANSKKKYITGTIELPVKKKYTIKALITPTNAINKSVIWESSNPEVATVKNGVVTGKSQGTAYISAKTVDSGKMTGIYVHVNIPVKTIKLGARSMKLAYGSYGHIDVTTILPENATNKSLKFVSSNESVAVVDQCGNIYIAADAASKKKSCTITVYALDGSGKKAKCTVKAVAPSN